MTKNKDKHRDPLWHAVVRDRDGEIRAMFDWGRAAKAWCEDWNKGTDQNPYHVELTDSPYFLKQRVNDLELHLASLLPDIKGGTYNRIVRVLGGKERALDIFHLWKSEAEKMEEQCKEEETTL